MSIVKDERIAHIWRVVKVVKVTMGLTFGLYLFTYGPYLYEKFGGDANAKTAMLAAMVFLLVSLVLQALFEIPTGAIGDAIGRVKTVTWSFLFRMFFFVFLMLMAPFSSITVTFTIAMIACVLFAIGYTFFSGTFTAWCVDSLRESAPDIGYEHILSRGYNYEFMAQLVGSIIGVLCYQYDMAYAAYIAAAFICFFCATTCRAEMQEVKNVEFLDKDKASGREMLRRMGEIMAVGFDLCRKTNAIFWLIMIFSAYMFLLNIVDYLWPVYVKSVIPTKTEQTVCWIGLSLLFLSSSIVGSHVMTKLGDRWKANGGTKTHNSSLRKWLIASTITSSLPIITLSGFAYYYGQAPFLLFVMAALAVEFSYGLVAPCYETLLNNYIPDAHAGERATIMSFGSMLKGLVVLLFAIPAGGGSGTTTIVGWVAPAILLLICTLIGWNRLRKCEVVAAIEPAGVVDLGV